MRRNQQQINETWVHSLDFSLWNRPFTRASRNFSALVDPLPENRSMREEWSDAWGMSTKGKGVRLKESLPLCIWKSLKNSMSTGSVLTYVQAYSPVDGSLRPPGYGQGPQVTHAWYTEVGAGVSDVPRHLEEILRTRPGQNLKENFYYFIEFQKIIKHIKKWMRKTDWQNAYILGFTKVPLKTKEWNNFREL